MISFTCRSESCQRFNEEDDSGLSCGAIGSAIMDLPWDADCEIGAYNTTEICPRDLLDLLKKNRRVRANMVIARATILDQAECELGQTSTVSTTE
jgi:hypothetical protein